MVVFSGWGGGRVEVPSSQTNFPQPISRTAGSLRECFIMSMDESGLNLFDSTTKLSVI